MDGSEGLAQRPQVKGGAEQALHLLQLEADVRRCESLAALVHHCANETRGLLRFRQAFVLRRRGKNLRVDAVSSVSVLERNAPLIRQVEATMKAAKTQGSLNDVRDVTLVDAAHFEDYAFPYLIWFPFLNKKGVVFGGLLIAREQPCADRTRVVGKRLGETYTHSWLALTKGVVSTRRPIVSRVGVMALVAGIAALGFVKAPITAIAPVEVVGRDTLVVTSPLDGIVEEVLVAPNQPVSAGDVLVRFVDTELRNAAAIARQNVLVAQSRLASASTGAFGDPNARKDVAIARAELALAEAELDLSQERLARTELKAGVAGLAVFYDAEEWRGRPVSIGERILDIAAPDRIEYAIALPVADLIALEESRPVRVFLDSAPLDARSATITRSSYHAVPQGDGLLAFDIRAEDDAQDAVLPRIGARGTAQVLGADATLAFIIFRRPLAWARQTFGY